MRAIQDGVQLWAPSPERIASANLTHYLGWLRDRGHSFDNYRALWEWSVTDLDGFWGSIWDYFDVVASVAPDRVLGRREMPGAQWFPGARLNYAENALRHERPDDEALIYLSEQHGPRSLGWEELGAAVRRLAVNLRSMGLKPGDRVVAYLPNTPEALVAMLAVTSTGAIWSSCGPDFGPRGALDRFAQLEPKFVFCVDGYVYGGKPFDRRPELAAILEGLPTVEKVIYVRHLAPSDPVPLGEKYTVWEDAISGPPVPRDAFHFEQVPFDHPLWILFSSGTTGLPKAIIHSHGGMIIEQYKAISLQMDVHPRERMFFFTTTGWMMWNFIVSALLLDAVPVLYDGNPAFPAPEALWRMVEQTGASYFGASPTYIGILDKAGIVPRERCDLGSLRSIVLAGSPVSAEVTAWVYDNVKADIWASPGSGGTDVCTGIVGGAVTQPVYAGEIQAPQLGVAARAFDGQGHEIIDEVGELVITQPMPSMPVGFWNDPDGSRMHESYFDQYPGIWRHGDFFKVNERGGCFVLGRSDATLNRHGIRIGTAEIYRSLLSVNEVEDALIVNLDLPGGHFFMPLFVKVRSGNPLDEALKDKIRARLRADYSARHIPDKIYAVPEIPYTLTGKKMEIPVRRILMGAAPEKAANRAGMAKPEALDAFIEYARTQTDYRF